MKIILSIVILILMILMLEFNVLRGIFPNAYMWIEPLLAFGAMIALIIWNGLHKITH